MSAFDNVTIDPTVRLDEAQSAAAHRCASPEVDRLMGRLGRGWFEAFEGVGEDDVRAWADPRVPGEMPGYVAEQVRAVTGNLLAEAYAYAIGAINADGVYVAWYPDRASYERDHSDEGEWDYDQYVALVVLTYAQTYALAGETMIAFVEPSGPGPIVTYDKNPDASAS